MKKMKKLVGILLTLAMVVAMSITAFAANITIKGGANGSKYAAYKLLNVTDLGASKYDYKVNTKYEAALKDAIKELKKSEEEVTDEEVINYLKTLQNNSEGIRIFADKIYSKINSMTAEAQSGDTNSNVLSDVDNGYYLVVETNPGNAQDTISLVMLGTVGNQGLEVTTKEDVPTLEKKVQEKNDSTGTITGWQDGADYDIGDDVPFKLTGTVSDKYDNYKTYAYTFHDTMSEGLSFNSESVVVKVDNKVVDKQYYTVKNSGTENENKCTFEVSFTDLKLISGDEGKLVKSTSKITVEYTAKLNENAVIGSAGNPNEARLEYSNNPYGDETGTTPPDKVIVFTYKLVANKVDGSGNPLAGAGFTLYKWNKSSEAEDKYEAVGSEIKGTDEDPKTRFEFSHLDAGQYKLVETTVPAGYNKAADLEFKVVASYDTDSVDPAFKKLEVTDLNGNNLLGDTFTISQEKDKAITTTITNLSGTELPSTGGMGTTILYVIGAILVIGAGILLVTKKRMNANK